MLYWPFSEQQLTEGVEEEEVGSVSSRERLHEGPNRLI